MADFPPDAPFLLKEDPTLGRFLVSQTSLPAEELVLTCVPYAFAINDSHRKRVCAVCLAFNDKGVFHLHCKFCDQVYFCSPACLATALASGHHTLCTALRRLATFKAPSHEKSVLKIVLSTLHARRIERDHNIHITPVLRDALNAPAGDDAHVVPDVSAAAPLAVPDLGETRMPRTRVASGSSTFSMSPSMSPARSPSLGGLEGLDKASLQQHIQRRVRLLTSGSNSSSSHPYDDPLYDDPDEPFRPCVSNASAPRSAATLSTHFPLPQNPAHSFAPPTTATLVQELSAPMRHSSIPVDPAWADVENLQSHYDDWASEDAKDWKKMKNFLVRLLEDCDLLEAEDRSPPGPTGDTSPFVMHLISKIESNGFGLYSPRKEQCMGRAVFPMSSYFNHSCDPNCECVQNARVMTVRTIRPVEEGEPLTISYIDSNMPLQARRTRLQADYYFLCQCQRCTFEEKSTGSSKLCYARSQAKEKVGKGRNGNSRHQQKQVPTPPQDMVAEVTDSASLQTSPLVESTSQPNPPLTDVAAQQDPLQPTTILTYPYRPRSRSSVPVSNLSPSVSYPLHGSPSARGRGGKNGRGSGRRRRSGTASSNGAL